jgi:hypothetical protein
VLVCVYQGFVFLCWIACLTLPFLSLSTLYLHVWTRVIHISALTA